MSSCGYDARDREIIFIGVREEFFVQANSCLDVEYDNAIFLDNIKSSWKVEHGKFNVRIEGLQCQQK